MNLALRQIGIILWKDLLIDLRRKENILAMFFFSLLTLLIFQFSLGGEEDLRYRLTPRVVADLKTEATLGPAQGVAERLMGRTFPTQQAFLKAVQADYPEITGAQRLTLLRAAKRSFLQESVPGLLWVSFLLAGVLGLSKSFGQERENGCMDGLLLTPVSRGVLYLGKMGSNALFLILLLVLVVPVFALLFQAPLGAMIWPLSPVLLGGVIGFCALGTLLGGLTSTLRGKEVLLPLLLFPLITPILIVVVQLTSVILEGGPLSEEMGWINLLIAGDVVFLMISYLVFEYVMEA